MQQYWVADLFSFTQALGHCFTYNPPPDGIPSFDGGIGMFLGHKDSDNSHLYQHQIYIHEKGQFWPNVNLPGVYKLKQSLNKITQLYVHAVDYKKIRDSFTINIKQLLKHCKYQMENTFATNKMNLVSPHVCISMLWIRLGVKLIGSGILLTQTALLLNSLK